MHFCKACNNTGFREDGEVCCSVACTARHDAAKGLKARVIQEKVKDDEESS